MAVVLDSQATLLYDVSPAALAPKTRLATCAFAGILTPAFRVTTSPGIGAGGTMALAFPFPKTLPGRAAIPKS